MFQVRVQVTIRRPVDEVFEYLANFENNPKWQGGMKEATFTSEGPLRVGSTYDQVASFLGRRVESSFEVIAYEAGRMVKATTTSGSFPITFTRKVSALESGTEVSAIIEGDASGFFQIAAPILKMLVQRSINADYKNLKKVLEGTS